MHPQLEPNASLKALNAFGVDATAALLAQVQQPTDLAEVLGDPRVAGYPKLVLGGGTNLLSCRIFLASSSESGYRV